MENYKASPPVPPPPPKKKKAKKKNAPVYQPIYTQTGEAYREAQKKIHEFFSPCPQSTTTPETGEQ